MGIGADLWLVLALVRRWGAWDVYSWPDWTLKPVDEIPEVLAMDKIELDRPSDSDSASLFSVRRRSRSCSFFSLRSFSIAIAALLAREMPGAGAEECVEEGVAGTA